VGLKQRNRAKERPIGNRLPNVLKIGLSPEFKKAAIDMIARGLKPIEQLHGEKGQSHETITGLTPIRDIQLTTRLQHTQHFSQGTLFVFSREVMKE